MPEMHTLTDIEVPSRHLLFLLSRQKVELLASDVREFQNEVRNTEGTAVIKLFVLFFSFCLPLAPPI